MSIINQAKHAFKWTLYLRGMSQVLTWLISLLVIRFLTPADYGIVALTEIIFMLVTLLCSAGLGDVIIQRAELNERFNRQVLNLLILFTAVLCSSLFWLAPILAAFYQQPDLTFVLQLSSVVFLCLPWLVLASSLLAKQLNFKTRGQIDLTAAVTTALLSLLLAYQGFGFWALIISNLLNILLRTIGYNWSLGRFYMPVFDLTGMRAPLKFGLTVAATSLLFGLFMKIDVLVIAKQMDAATLGFYALAMHLALLPMTKLMPLVNEVAYPMYAAIKKDPAEYQRVFAAMLRLISFVVFPVFFIFSAVCYELVGLLLGSQWLPAVVALKIIALTIPFRIISNLFSPLLKALGFPQTGLQHVSFSCVVVGLCFYYAAPYGLLGLAYAWLIVTPLILLFALFLSTKRAGISIQLVFGAMLKPVLFAGCSWVCVQQSAHWLPETWPTVVLLCIKLCLAVSCYLVLSWFFNRSQLLEVAKFRL